MKKLVLILLLIAGCSTTSLIAQNGTALGTRVNVATGLWGQSPVIMPVHAGMDFGLSEEISIGFDIGWRLFNDAANHSVFVFQFRGDYYFNTLIGLDRVWDVYAGLQMGPGIITAPANYGGSVEGFNWTLDGYAGGRWYFSEKAGLNAEVGLMGVFPDIVGPTPFMSFGITFGI
jgi:hypothetical protein